MHASTAPDTQHTALLASALNTFLSPSPDFKYLDILLYGIWIFSTQIRHKYFCLHPLQVDISTDAQIQVPVEAPQEVLKVLNL